MPTITPRDWKKQLGDFLHYYKGDGDSIYIFIETLLEEARQDAREEVITYISKDQGWEETEDNYRELFGFAPKYSSL